MHFNMYMAHVNIHMDMKSQRLMRLQTSSPVTYLQYWTCGAGK